MPRDDDAILQGLVSMLEGIVASGFAGTPDAGHLMDRMAELDAGQRSALLAAGYGFFDASQGIMDLVRTRLREVRHLSVQSETILLDPADAADDRRIEAVALIGLGELFSLIRLWLAARSRGEPGAVAAVSDAIRSHGWLGLHRLVEVEGLLGEALVAILTGLEDLGGHVDD